MEARIGIKEAAQATTAHELGKLLADEFLLYTKTRNAHWNVEGSDFYSKHKFFEDQFNELDEIMDSVAERIRTLGHYAPGTMKEYIKLTHLTEATRNPNDSAGFVKQLLGDHESIIIKLREAIEQMANGKDFGTTDFITGVMQTHEKMAWMLRAHLAQ